MIYAHANHTWIDAPILSYMTIVAMCAPTAGAPMRSPSTSSCQLLVSDAVFCVMSRHVTPDHFISYLIIS